MPLPPPAAHTAAPLHTLPRRAPLPLTALLAGLWPAPCAQPPRPGGQPRTVAPVVALVGAGGKTTLLYALARALAETGCRAVCATTTHIFPPSPAHSPLYLLSPPLSAVAEALSHHGRVTVAGHAITEGKQQGKLSGLPPEGIDALRTVADIVLVEADGAAMRPLKAPAAHEPAVPSCASLCLALCGLGGVGQPFSHSVHRPELAAALCGCAEGTPVTAAHMAHLTLHAHGLFRTTPPTARRAVLCMLPEDMPPARGLHLACEAARTARRCYPHLPCAWWLGSARQGWVTLL